MVNDFYPGIIFFRTTSRRNRKKGDIVLIIDGGVL
jgi:hypothetical protein